ncbi:MAG: methyl-accepting chemotaxis protein [Treponema sp.]|jgi:iron only hydrogenase large subunit-like protein/ABC-type transporter Mla subunit MlaD|nr:methyl-accepting chemotaxis protein [Treponema sp.]
MDNTGRLAPVIKIDNDKCVNCYACITACPVKYCIDGSGEKLEINNDLCIGCGHCIAVCSHEARHPIDDTERFFEDLKQGEKIIAIAAPAVASVFPGNYLRLNGYIQSLGVKAVFDVSLGAELTVVSYLNYIKEKKPKIVIAQPCPAIVSFVEIYCPNLLPCLAPADSPMLHTLKMIREYFPQYQNCKMAVISPCIAKKREFEETQLGDYNVTMLALKKHVEKKGIDLGQYPVAEYIGPLAERAVTFSSPGGLLDTAERFVPGIRRNTRKIEGIHAIYPYLREVSHLLDNPNIEFPLLIDCLNCELGCNGGPGTGNGHMSMDELETPIRKRSAELEKQLNPKQKDKLYKNYHKLLGRYWKSRLYDRTYKNLSGNYTLKLPSDKEVTEVYKELEKHDKSDVYDCTACGYGTCKSMAIAVFNKLNKPDNCAHYTQTLLEKEKKTIVYINVHLKEKIGRALSLIEGINNLVDRLNNRINTQSESVDESSVMTGKMLSSLKTTSELSRQKRESVKGLIDNAAKGQDAMRETIQSVQGISESVDGIAAAIKIISVIASNTNLLAMNAAIEAAHAGDAGRGFAVVADEIRRLSETTRENSRSISQTLSSIIARINTTSKHSGDAGNLINEMSGEINGFVGTMTELIDTLSELSSESSGVTNSLDNLKDTSSAVKTDYVEMLSLTDKLRYDINFLSAMSADIVRAIEEDDQEIIARLISMDNKSESGF